MAYKLGNITIYIEKDYNAMSRRGAQVLASQIYAKPTANLGLATGGTPVGMYKELIRMYKEGIVDFSQVTTFNLDEYYPISRQNDQSYFHFMNENLFSHVNVDPSRINIPNGESADIEQECLDYEEKIKQAGGLDFQLLGIGNNGHIAFNEPDEHFEPRTHVVTLEQNTIESNARFFKSIDDVPRKAISMGIGSILSARKILLLASGAAKAEVVKKMLYGKISPMVPASILQVHHDVTIVLAEDAAAEIK